jgi:nucleotide-binding universal stress UspA family protein
LKVPTPRITPGPGAILVAIDGEPHTAAATRWAIDLATLLDREVVGLHVRDPYLKQFHTEIYAQGRLEYLDHVDQCLASDAEEATSAFGTLATDANVRWRVKTTDGEPIEQITREAETGDYALLILGRRPRKGFAAWRSRDLPGKILAAVSGPPILLVPADAD